MNLMISLLVAASPKSNMVFSISLVFLNLVCAYWGVLILIVMNMEEPNRPKQNDVIPVAAIVRGRCGSIDSYNGSEDEPGRGGYINGVYYPPGEYTCDNDKIYTA